MAKKTAATTTAKAKEESQFTLTIECQLLTDLLGTLPGDDKIYSEFIKTKTPEGTIDEDMNFNPEMEIEKKTTYFRRNSSGELCLADYQIKGFLKSTGDAIRRRVRKENGAPTKGAKSGWESWLSNCDMNVHVFPRLISLGMIEPDGIVERPLRAQTMQGPRVSLARSEMIREDKTFTFEIVVRGGVSREQIIECLEEGKYTGLGQWRNAGYGRIIYRIV